MISMPIMGLGFVLGMQHALEADHIAAVSSIAARRTTVADIVKHGLTWGLGHSLTLFAFAGAAIVLGWAIPDTLTQPLEGAVGVMLVALGAHVLWRLWRDRVHFHRQRCRHGHILAHERFRDEVPAASAEHSHEHGFRWRSLAVGLMHGIAGSAALLVLAVSQVADPLQGVAYVVLFGLGSMIGMGTLSSVIAVPLVVSARLLSWTNQAVQSAVGLITIAVGGITIHSIIVHANV
jgi:ABC-type nickel/cobalt efflux system permease component RcnA